MSHQPRSSLPLELALTVWVTLFAVSGKAPAGKDAQGHQTTHGYAGVPGLFVSYGQSTPASLSASACRANPHIPRAKRSRR